MKDIIDYEGLYAITEDGKVWSYRSNKFLSPSIINGYKFVSLSKDGRKKGFYVHRLIAQAYIPNPMNLPHVSHIDESRDNNCVSNLEWSSIADNMNMPQRKERIGSTHRKRIYCITNDTIYESQTEAAKALGINRTSIVRVCKGEYFSVSGYRFKYYEE